MKIGEQDHIRRARELRLVCLQILGGIGDQPHSDTEDKLASVYSCLSEYIGHIRSQEVLNGRHE